MVLETASRDVSGQILGCFSDKEPGNHSELWGMVLAFSKALPCSWDSVDARKAVMPKLLAFFRFAAYFGIPPVQAHPLLSFQEGLALFT